MTANMIPKIQTDSQPPIQYAIQVHGRLNQADWVEWFGGLAIEVDEGQGITCLSGPIADQAELYGLLARLRNVGLALISVEPIVEKGSESS